MKGVFGRGGGFGKELGLVWDGVSRWLGRVAVGGGTIGSWSLATCVAMSKRGESPRRSPEDSAGGQRASRICETAPLEFRCAGFFEKSTLGWIQGVELVATFRPRVHRLTNDQI